MQLPRQCAVNRMIDGNIEHSTAAVDDGVQFIRHLLGRMTAENGQAYPVGVFSLKNISARRCMDGVSCGAQKCDIADDDLSGYAEFCGKDSGGNRFSRCMPGQTRQNLLAPCGAAFMRGCFFHAISARSSAAKPVMSGVPCSSM